MDAFGAAAALRNSSMRIMLLEENAWPTGPADHGLARGIGHAAYSNMLQRRADLVPVHGYANGLLAWQCVPVMDIAVSRTTLTLAHDLR
jgi:hypothetical protein